MEFDGSVKIDYTFVIINGSDNGKDDKDKDDKDDKDDNSGSHGGGGGGGGSHATEPDITPEPGITDTVGTAVIYSGDAAPDGADIIIKLAAGAIGTELSGIKAEADIDPTETGITLNIAFTDGEQPVFPVPEEIVLDAKALGLDTELLKNADAMLKTESGLLVRQQMEISGDGIVTIRAPRSAEPMRAELFASVQPKLTRGEGA